MIILRLILTLVLGFPLTFVGAAEPDALYLTWVDDPTTTMSVVWHGGSTFRVMYHPIGDARWMAVIAQPQVVPETKTTVYVAHLQGLKRDSTYIFKIEGSRREFKFRTLPSHLSREVRFVVGGDIYYHWGTEILERMNRAIAYDDPDFVVLGGDLAYTTGTKRALKGRLWEIERWQSFFHILQRTMITKEGRMIPLVPVIGNHDVHPKGLVKKSYPAIFYEIFPFPEEGKAYRDLKVGTYLKFVLLDTGHSWPIEGDQTEWLKSTLRGDKTPYLFAIYHVGAYPSVYKYKGHISEAIRKNWVPFFEQAQICGAFEHHSHALKRTFPIKEGKKDPEGVIYLGDGSWGCPPRKVRTPDELWYLARSESVNACWFVHLSKQGALIEARTPTGEVKDRVSIGCRE